MSRSESIQSRSNSARVGVSAWIMAWMVVVVVVVVGGGGGRGRGAPRSTPQRANKRKHRR